MKQLRILIIFFLLTTGLFLFLKIRQSSQNNQFLKYQLNWKKLKLLTADQPEEWNKGLMFYKKPVDFDGMIFIFPDKKIRTFWNKNTYLELDVYWFEDDKIVGKSFLPSIKESKKIIIVQSPKEVNKVIEIVR